MRGSSMWVLGGAASGGDASELHLAPSLTLETSFCWECCPSLWSSTAWVPKGLLLPAVQVAAQQETLREQAEHVRGLEVCTPAFMSPRNVRILQLAKSRATIHASVAVGPAATFMIQRPMYQQCCRLMGHHPMLLRLPAPTDCCIFLLLLSGCGACRRAAGRGAEGGGGCCSRTCRRRRSRGVSRRPGHRETVGERHLAHSPVLSLLLQQLALSVQPTKVPTPARVFMFRVCGSWGCMCWPVC